MLILNNKYIGIVKSVCEKILGGVSNILMMNDVMMIYGCFFCKFLGVVMFV